MHVRALLSLYVVVATFAWNGAAADAGTLVTQNTDPVTIAPGASVACQTATATRENSYYRVFDLGSFGPTVLVDSVTIGVEQVTGSPQLTLALYRLDGAFTLANLTMLGSPITVNAPTSAPQLFTFTVSPAVAVSTSKRLVVEVLSPDGTSTSTGFWLGANHAGQTAPGYLRAPDCSAVEPTDVASLGFPAADLIINLDVVPLCGNGAVDAGETCDDGNTVAGDGCNATCTSDETCGNGIIDSGEVCDDSNVVDGDGCSATCMSDETCGNGVVDLTEACDDGNTSAGDGCDATCTSDETCGNGFVDPDEVCDDANTTAGDGCDATCSSDETCGNNTVDLGEACDDGNTVSSDGCNATCTSDETCGNGVVDMGERCDDGNTTAGDGCDASCSSNEMCGNGLIDTGEACDDGNAVNGDGCNAVCSVETCGNGVVDEGETCDDGNATNGDGCEASCEMSASEDPGGCCRSDRGGSDLGGTLLAGVFLAIRLRRRRRDPEAASA